jgi:hypothetical protein
MKDDLIGIEYQRRADGSYQLETKKDMKKRDLASPDLGDALALTFAKEVSRKTLLEELSQGDVNMCQTEYDLFADTHEPMGVNMCEH